PDAAGAAVPRAAPLPLVASGRERLVASPAEDDDADVLVRPGGPEGVDQLVDGLRAKRISHLGAVDPDPRHPGARLVEDVLVRHAGRSARASVACQGSRADA